MKYFRDVQNDFEELKVAYPFSTLTFPLSCSPECALIRVVAVNKILVDAVNGVEMDFLGEYSKELYLKVPVDYKEQGCYVYGARWLDIKKLNFQDIHLIHEKNIMENNIWGYKLCVGTPESFVLMQNVILENVRTAEHMLIGYERIMRGETKSLEIIAYAHGDAGRKQFKKNKHRFISKK